ncbi:MAG TPA: bacillithiol biosynthesis cysteine-adding enzyme BshC [Puia sp.]|nr:bacillithiol biosynthesis cysteine-adding enzyme BshC [Puia sp.]
MDWISTRLPYQQTGYYSRIITDYLEQADELSPFYKHPVSAEGLRRSIEARKAFPTDRGALVGALEEQYASVPAASRVQENIALLAKENTFTVTTAHQPAIFTGHLYFIYKILHIIRLAEWLKEQHPAQHFVPVFFMGSEDADLDELGHIYLGGEKLVWETKQTGAVGRMKTKGLDKVFYRIEGQLSVRPHGPELMQLLKTAYLESPDIQTATFRLLHSLFAEYGLIVLIADKAVFKKQMLAVFEDDLFRQEPTQIVSQSINELSKRYKIQANPRPINLFYLKDDLRARIERTPEGFQVVDSKIRFTEAELRDELLHYPDRFSPNVILRGLFQETILPNLAFIGGGGETAYWLELKGLFERYRTPFPVLILRNSFLLVQRHWMEKLTNAGFSIPDLFRGTDDLVNDLVRRDSEHTLNLEEEIAAANHYYENLKALARPVDPTLEQHVTALQARALEPIKSLEKKLLKAERRRFGDQQRQLAALKADLFPHDNLQERVENFLPWYAALGPGFIHDLYRHSQALEQQFVVLTEE